MEASGRNCFFFTSGNEVRAILISIGSKNLAKIAAVKNAFKEYRYEIVSVDVASGVSAQPMTDKETIQGAINRATSAATEMKAEIGIGLEGGVQQTTTGLFLCNWGALKVKDLPPFIAGGARIPLPQDIADRILQGEELGPIMNEFSKKQNVRHKEGAVGVFTNGQINRTDMFFHIVKLLLGQYEFALNSKLK